MKKVFKTLALCGLIALAFSACKKNNETSGNMTFKATISQPTSNAKTHIGEDNMLVWDAGNTIKVLNETGQYGDFTTSDNNVVTATFTGTLTSTDSYTAFYPNAQFDGTNVRIAVGSSQTYVADNFANNSYPILASNTGDNFIFHSHAGVLRLQFWSNSAVTVGSITVTGAGSGNIAGTLVYPFDYHYNPTDLTPYTVEGGTNSVTLNCGSGVNLQSVGTTMPVPVTFNIILLEGALSNGFAVTLNALDGSEIQSFIAPQGNTITKENILIMPALEVTGTGGGGDEHQYVDLGLPSGLLWATCNVGADTPEGYGDYFAWGETTTKDTYNWSTYQYCMGSNTTLTKYCNNSSYGYNGFTDNLTTLLPEDDAAAANWGGNWRMPTKEEFQELYNNTTVTWTQQNGVNGRLFTASNGNSLFLPAAGERWDGELYDAGDWGDYWSSSLNTDGPDYAWDFSFDSGYYNMYGDYRGSGFTVRPVRCKNSVITVNANPTAGGTVSGGGTYMDHTTCTLTATANSGYAFENWTDEDGLVISTEATYTFTVSGNRSLVANFTAGDSHAYVDLGLPSGLLWATCNVGADTPEGYGDYFAWGETTTKSTYNWSTYQYCNGSSNTLTKYCSNASYGFEGFTDGLTTLLPEDDAATANWGNGWRMPTQEEWEELKNNTTVTWTQQNSVNGRLFTASNGNSLFLPAAGYRDDVLNFAGVWGYYWSSSLYTDSPSRAWYFGCFNSGYNPMGYNNRYDGLTVRPVREN